MTYPCEWPPEFSAPSYEARGIRLILPFRTVLAYQHAGPLLASAADDGEVFYWRPAVSKKLRWWRALGRRSRPKRSAGKEAHCMCTTKNEREVMVCDVSIERVRQDLEAALPARVRYTHVDGVGTLVAADTSVDSERFQAVVQAAIAAAQSASSG